ncbi:LysM peptidoglycan-binding domain-containing protein [Tumebacillus lipolyticus]|uniref:LysM peptidoglycan-binding domain-containing protein n=1 Tax=Tumebacillus lipolyticus TaxID=1280370 RepID=A0ABW5A2I0_9BACL
MIVIAGVAFSGLAAPDTFGLGGEQKTVVTELPGGSIVYQPRGYFIRHENTWEGSFYRLDALEICMKFDRICATNQTVLVEFGSYSYWCKVVLWEWNWQRDKLIEFKITLHRDFTYSPATAAKADPVARFDSSAGKQTAATSQKVHTVVSGDTLSHIALKYFGKASEYPRIYAANKTVIGTNPNLLKVGMKLVIPS